MSENSSSFNDSLPHPHHSSGFHGILHGNCYIDKPSSIGYDAFYLTRTLLLLPLSTFILYLGLQRSTTATTASHSDVFTYHMVAMELVGVCSSLVMFSGIHADRFDVFLVGFYVESFIWYGQTVFHLLTCFERYLAVVHPTTYITLRGDRGVRVRNISVGCCWPLCVVLTVMEHTVPHMILCTLVFSVIVTSFFSLSVLRVLIRPGPGERGGARERVDQSKQRAFYTIVAIQAVLLWRFAWNVSSSLLNTLTGRTPCSLVVTGLWFELPSSLVLPLLFLLRAGKMACCSNTN